MRTFFVFGFIIAMAALLGTPVVAAPERPERPAGAGSSPKTKKGGPNFSNGDFTPSENDEAMMKYLAYIPEDVQSGTIPSGWAYRYDIRIGPDNRGVIMRLGGVREKPFIDGLGRRASVELVARKKNDKTELGVKLPSRPVIVRDEQWVREEVDSIVDQGLAIPVKFVVEGKWLDAVPPAFIRTPKAMVKNAKPEQEYSATAGALIVNGEDGYLSISEPLFTSFSDRFGFSAKLRLRNGEFFLDVEDVTLGYLQRPAFPDWPGSDAAQYVRVKFTEKGRRISALPGRLWRYPDRHLPGEKCWISQSHVFIRVTKESRELRFDFAKGLMVAREPFTNPYGPAVGVRWANRDSDREIGGDWDPPVPKIFWRWPIRRESPTPDETNGNRYQYCAAPHRP